MKNKLTITVTFLITLIACSAFWYARAYYFTGNPVYPMQVSDSAGNVILPGAGADLDMKVFPWHHIPDWLKAKLDERHWTTVFLGAFDPWGGMNEESKWGGFGPVFGVMMLPAIPCSLVIALRRKEWGFLMLMLCVAVPFVLFPQHTWARFIMPVVVAGMLGMARIMKEFES